MESGIRSWHAAQQLAKRAARAIAAMAGEVKLAAQKVLIDPTAEGRSAAKLSRKRCRAYRSYYRGLWRSQITGSKLQRKAAQHKLGGRTSRLIQRFVRRQQPALLVQQ